jgi:hypothetical protein
MTVIQYCTPEWLEQSAKHYRQNPSIQKKLEKFTLKICMRIRAEPDWGIDQDIIMGADVNKGELIELGFLSEAEAKETADYILSATPQQWKKLLRGESMLTGDVLLGRIAIEQGSKTGMINIAPYAPTFIIPLTQVDLQFPDEMSPEELDRYRVYINEFREKLAV